MKSNLLVVITMLSSPAWLRASEQIDYKSPDGKFAQRETMTELNPVHGDTANIETVLIPFGNF